MSRKRNFIAAALTCLGCLLLLPERGGAAPPADKPLKILIVTGGHPFDEVEFFNVFREMKNVAFDQVKFGAGAEEKFTSGAAKSYDALVFYDMNQDCSAYADSLLDLFAAGKGAVFLHHALGSCPDVEEYSWLVGGRARWKKAPGANLTISKYKHDESYRAHPVTTHPIAASMSDFDVHDETFWNYFVNTDNDAFLTTTYPGSAKTLGWTHQYKNSKIAYLQLGHDKVAYANPNYRRLVERMILWVTGKLPAQ